ncbi:MAG TPA: twin-arginine translocase TatA/TatE family subunit [Thermodesulfovibrionales bacterium]|nr:twin-arginine translocase TatA/TatE family subunit [Thermodesulfovibrionales bacterium]
MHLIIILVIALVVFGPSRLPELGKGIGKGIRDFKKALSDDDKDSPCGVKKEAITEDSAEEKA